MSSWARGLMGPASAATQPSPRMARGVLVLLISLVWADTMRRAAWPAGAAGGDNDMLPSRPMGSLHSAHGNGGNIAGQPHSLSREHSHTCAITPSPGLWTNFNARRDGKQSAVFTPYHITPGGGEKYLLSAVRAMQSMGHFVTVYVRPGNLCTSITDLMQTAEFLRVPLDPTNIELTLWNDQNLAAQPAVDVFFVLGNEKYPQVRGIGMVNIFMCQFPFDLDRPMPPHFAAHLGGFQFVVLNSFFSFGWYNRLLEPWIVQQSHHGGLVPEVQVLYPPVSLMPLTTSVSPRKHIVLLGRFFQGRQSKGHPAAVRMFADLRGVLPDGTTLFLIGQLVHDHEAYFQELHDLVSRLHLTGSVQIINAAPTEVVNGYLLSALIQWHLTGLDTDSAADPASLEHFGISIVEGMSTGTIPIACHGGPEDIIEPGVNGYIAQSLDDVRRMTAHVFGLSQEEKLAMSQAGRERADVFAASHFQDSYVATVNRGFASRAYRALIADTLVRMRWCAATVADAALADPFAARPYAALIVEPTNHWGLEYGLLHTRSALSTNSKELWSLHVVHSRVNQVLVDRILARHTDQSIRAHLWPGRIPEFGKLLSTPSLWQLFSTGTTRVLLLTPESLLLSPASLHKYMDYDLVGPSSCANGDVLPTLGSVLMAEPGLLHEAATLKHATGAAAGGVSTPSNPATCVVANSFYARSPCIAGDVEPVVMDALNPACSSPEAHFTMLNRVLAVENGIQSGVAVKV
ncbi:hypothetical protein FOA52_000769 [Chlamydomonas sp. UWO 241]|nr:hypothetical protein FOA52_000769 [Chlamydomonas sp. UWO 241]